MEMNTRPSRDAVVVEISGRLDSLTSSVALEKMTRIIEEHSRVVIDLAELEFMTSAGLRVLLSAAKTLKSRRGQLKLCNANPEVRQVLEICGFPGLIRLYATEAEAIGSFQTDRP